MKITNLSISPVEGGVWIVVGDRSFFHPYTPDMMFSMAERFIQVGRSSMRNMPFTVDE